MSTDLMVALAVYAIIVGALAYRITRPISSYIPTPTPRGNLDLSNRDLLKRLSFTLSMRAAYAKHTKWRLGMQRATRKAFA